MIRFLPLSYGALCTGVFPAAFAYAIGFVGNIAVPRSVDHGVAAPIGQAVVVNVLLRAVFAIRHSVMARPAFKRWRTRFVPESVERSTYVVPASLVLFLLFWQWHMLGFIISFWATPSMTCRHLLFAIVTIGYILVAVRLEKRDLVGAPAIPAANSAQRWARSYRIRGAT